MTQAATQIVPTEEIELSVYMHDIRGHKFGLLTAIRPIENRRTGVLWLCECECGRFAIRSITTLRAALRDNRESQCIQCLREMRSGWFRNQKEYWHEYHLLLWLNEHKLYTDKQLEGIEREILADLKKLDFPIGEPPESQFDSHGVQQSEPYGAMSDGTDYTLEEVGEEIGYVDEELEGTVSRERVRQIEAGAMRFLLAKHGRLLKELMYGEVSKPLKLSPDFFVQFVGCKCRQYDRSPTGLHLYCTACGKVWPMSEKLINQVLTALMIERSHIEDPF